MCQVEKKPWDDCEYFQGKEIKFIVSYTKKQFPELVMTQNFKIRIVAV